MLLEKFVLLPSFQPFLLCPLTLPFTCFLLLCLSVTKRSPSIIYFPLCFCFLHDNNRNVQFWWAHEGVAGPNCKCGLDVCGDCALWPSSSPNKDTNSTMNHNGVQLWLVACLFLPLKDLPAHVPKDHILFIHSLFLPLSYFFLFFFLSQHTQRSVKEWRDRDCKCDCLGRKTQITAQ